MYEVELRSWVGDFEKAREKLDSIAKKADVNVREATVFFVNENKDDFHLRLRLRKDKCILGYKEKLEKRARKEIETEIQNPKEIFEILLNLGLKIRYIFARIRYSYVYDNFEILLNKVLDWGEALEVETKVENENEAENAEKEIMNFVEEKIGIKEWFDVNEMNEKLDEYNRKNDINRIGIGDLIDYVEGKKDSIF